MNRGYFGIGVFHPKKEENVGTLFRSAMALGAGFIFTIGRRYRQQSSDTCASHKYIPLFNYVDYDDFKRHSPINCPIVAIELSPDSRPIKNFVHPERCIYLLGAEDHGLPPKILESCYTSVVLPGKICLNVSVAGSLIMFDRVNKNG